MQLRYLKDGTLYKIYSLKNNNGTRSKKREKVEKYKIELQELTDEVSASIYGANINKTYRIISPHHKLEAFLYTKLGNESDNISKYEILYNSKYYKIVAVKKNWVDIELI